MENQSNPLKSYFRKPGIWIKLPSQGRFYETAPSGLNDMGEIAVYPMTAKDELLLKNADALLNGSAINELIKSCAPSISDPASMPSIDLDTILLAIRRSTYGENMEVSSVHTCSSTAKNDVILDLNQFISTIKTVDNIEPVVLDTGIKVFIKPISVKQLLHLNWIQFEQIRNLQIAEQNNLDEKSKIDLLQSSYEILTNENINMVGDCIDTVLLPDNLTVSDKNNIREWTADLSQINFKKIEKAIMNLGNMGMEKSFKIQCQHCKEEYDAQLDLNPTTFFG